MNNVWVILVLLLSGALQAQTVVLDELPKRMILPCEREIPVSKLTRAIIPMIPWRGINLAFPFELEEGTTNYTLSGGDVWAFDKAMKGSNIVTLTFKKFDQNKNWGTVQDFTISTPNYVFSFALHAVKDPSEHCTNIRLTLSDAERKRLLKEKKQNYRETLDQEYAAQFAALDNTAEEKALLMVGSLAQRKPDRTRIKEEGSLRLSNGDELVVYVKNRKPTALSVRCLLILKTTMQKKPSTSNPCLSSKKGAPRPSKGPVHCRRKSKQVKKQRLFLLPVKLCQKQVSRCNSKQKPVTLR